MKKLFITTLLAILLFPISAMSKGNDNNAMTKEVSDWYFGAKAKIFNKIDSLISNKGIINDKLTFELMLFDGNITGDGEAIEYINKILSYENSSPEAYIEALSILMYWNDILIKSSKSIDANKNLLQLEGKYPPKKDDVDIFLRLKPSILTSLEELINSKYTYIKIKAIHTLFALDSPNKYNDTIKDILVNLLQETNEKNWNLTAIPLKGRTLKCNFVKFQALTLLFKYDYVKAVKISEEILKNYIPDDSNKKERYEDYQKEVKNILLKNQR